MARPRAEILAGRSNEDKFVGVWRAKGIYNAESTCPLSCQVHREVNFRFSLPLGPERTLRLTSDHDRPFVAGLVRAQVMLRLEDF